MPSTATILVDTLHRWGVETVYGIPGDGVNGVMEALRERRDEVDFVRTSHEEAASLAAVAHAKFTGDLGACLATTGPGGVHLLNGLYDAKLDGQPVVAVTGVTYTDLEGTEYQQDVDLAHLLDDACVYSQEVNSPEHARVAADLACRHALARRGPAHVAVPVDVQREELDGDYTRHRIPRETSEAPVVHAPVPPTASLRAAADILQDAERPVILAGSGARGGARELATLAQRLQAPIVKALLGKDVLPDDHPLVLGGLGMLGTEPAEEAMEEADALLLVGTGFPYADHLPDPDGCRAVQIDIDPARIGLRWPVDVGLVGDAQATLQALLPNVEAQDPSSWLQGKRDAMEEWWSLMEDRGSRDGEPLKPQVVAWELGERLARDAIVCGDSGTTTTWLARYVRVRGDQRVSLSGTLATMGSAVPYAVAAQEAYPDRQVVAMLGDGALLMLAGELSTLAQRELPVTVVVFKNQALGQIEWEQMVYLGNPTYGTELPNVSYAALAEAVGVKGYTVDHADEVAPTLERALDTPAPTLVEAVVDPNEPPHPPEAEARQVRGFAKALARGEPSGGVRALTLFRDKLRDLTRRG